MATSNRDTFFNYLIDEYHHPFNGWDFSYLNGRRVDIHQQQHWDYAQIVTSVLDRGATISLGKGGSVASRLPLCHEGHCPTQEP